MEKITVEVHDALYEISVADALEVAVQRDKKAFYAKAKHIGHWSDRSADILLRVRPDGSWDHWDDLLSHAQELAAAG